MSDFIQQIKARMSQPLPGRQAQMKMAPLSRINQLDAPVDARQSGVMVLLFEEQNQWHTLLMLRASDGHVHSGQISFPGGKKEELDKDIVETAKRECEEEIGIKQEAIQIIGVLSPLYIPPSNFHVTPAVGLLNHPFEMNVSPYEVQEVIKMPLQTLFDDAKKEMRVITTSSNIVLESPVYLLNDKTVVWGATAMIISELEHLIKDLI